MSQRFSILIRAIKISLCETQQKSKAQTMIKIIIISKIEKYEEFGIF